MENPFDFILARLDRIEKILLEIRDAPIVETQITAGTKELMKIEEVAEYLYLKKQTIYGFTSRRKIPYIKIGRRVYFKRSEIDEFLNKGRRKTAAEIQEEANLNLRKTRRKN